MSCKNKVITSEYVSFGHPDKLADQIADAILDELIEQDKNTRAGIEVLVKDNVVVLGGELTTNAEVNYDKIVRGVFADVNYPASHGLKPEQIKVINLIGQQSQEIHQGVDRSETVIGAGDQGFCVGYASNETNCYMPLGHYLAKTICNYVSTYNNLGPDVKSQVVVGYDNDEQPTVLSILVSTMYDKGLSLLDVRRIVEDAIVFNYSNMDVEVYEKYIKDKDIKLDINPCGSWHTGGPVSDCGVTGRKIVVDQFGGYANVGGGAFCVDGNTEYIGEDLKWHKISEYNGGKIGQWNNGVLQFVMPSKYHVNDSEKMYHFVSPTSIDMVLSENHDIVAKTSKNNLYKIKVKDVIKKINNNTTGFKDSIPCTFEYYPYGEGVNLTDEQIRLQVAFCADGTYNSIPGDKGRINVRKHNKIDRIEWLLKETNTDYHLLNKGECSNHYYTFIPPVPNNKSLYSIFKGANYHQLAIIAKEVLKWDGDEKKGIFRTTIKEDADFIQFVFSIVYGKRVTIIVDNRIGQTKKLGEKEYEMKSVCYTVVIGKVNEISFGGAKSKISVSPFDTDKMYCFTVPSGMLLLRRNDKIFVTGNCGKDFTKVDRSGAYMARYLAKNIVAAGIADNAKVELAYMIGVPEPCALNIELNRNQERVCELKEWILKNVDTTPYGIIKRFDGFYPRNYHLARNGHYGQTDGSMLWEVNKKYYPWEMTDIANKLANIFA